MGRFFRVALVIVMAAAVLVGCASYYRGGGVLRNIALVKPFRSEKPVYEDNDIRVVFTIVDDKRIALDVTNKTRMNARLFWKNSTFASVDGDDVELGINFVDIEDGSNPAVSAIGPHDSITAEVFPGYSAFVDGEGRPDNRPLYAGADGKGVPEDLVGKLIGVNLVFELNGSTRMHRFRMSVTPSPPGAR